MMDTALFMPRAAAGAAIAMTSSTPGEPLRRLPQTAEVIPLHFWHLYISGRLCTALAQTIKEQGSSSLLLNFLESHMVPLETSQELSEAMMLFAESGSRAEYEAFAALSSLVPAEVSQAIPLQLRQLAPRPPVQSNLIDLVPIDRPAVPTATAAAANAPQSLLANRLCTSTSRGTVACPPCEALIILPSKCSLVFGTLRHGALSHIDGPLAFLLCGMTVLCRMQRLRWPPFGKLSRLCGVRQTHYR